MHGFIAFISNENGSFPSIEWKKTFPFQQKYIKRSVKKEHFLIEQYTSELFLDEKLFIENSDFILITDGVILNLAQLHKQYKTKEIHELIVLLYKECDDFFKYFEGAFVGIFFDKKAEKWFFFNNHTGRKKLFYYHDKQRTIVSTDLYTLSRAMDELSISKSLNIEASYLLLTSGFMHEDKTLISEVRQIRAGESGKLHKNYFSTDFYFHLNDIETTNESKKDIIHQIDYHFKEALRLEFEKDLEHGYSHLSTISAGLDSRMTSLVAYKLGYTDQHFFNFSHKGFVDDVVSKQIADSYNLPITQVSLLAESLLTIDDVVSVNDGLILYTGASHVLYGVSRLKSKAGIIHTGILGGDGTINANISDKIKNEAKISDGVYSTGLIDKAKDYLNKSIRNYKDGETYILYNHGFMGINNGHLFFDLIGETLSPFLNSKFLSYTYSIPREYKINRYIYIEWIKTLHPDLARFTWEGIGGRPTNNDFLRFFYRYKRAVIKRLPVKSMWKHHMVPEQLWYDTDKKVKEYLDGYFRNHIDLITKKELQKDVIGLYQKGGIAEKAQVLTLLAAIKLLF